MSIWVMQLSQQSIKNQEFFNFFIVFTKEWSVTRKKPSSTQVSTAQMTKKIGFHWTASWVVPLCLLKLLTLVFDSVQFKRHIWGVHGNQEVILALLIPIPIQASLEVWAFYHVNLSIKSRDLSCHMFKLNLWISVIFWIFFCICFFLWEIMAATALSPCPSPSPRKCLSAGQAC